MTREELLEYHLSCAVRATDDIDMKRMLCALSRGAREARYGTMTAVDIIDTNATARALGCSST